MYKDIAIDSVLPPGFRVGKKCGRGEVHFFQGRKGILLGRGQISDISRDHPGGELPTQSQKMFFEYSMKSFVLFLLLTLYSVKERVSVSLFFPIDIILLL